MTISRSFVARTASRNSCRSSRSGSRSLRRGATARRSHAGDRDFRGNADSCIPISTNTRHGIARSGLKPPIAISPPTRANVRPSSSTTRSNQSATALTDSGSTHPWSSSALRSSSISSADAAVSKRLSSDTTIASNATSSREAHAPGLAGSCHCSRHSKSRSSQSSTPLTDTGPSPRSSATGNAGCPPISHASLHSPNQSPASKRSDDPRHVPVSASPAFRARRCAASNPHVMPDARNWPFRLSTLPSSASTRLASTGSSSNASPSLSGARPPAKCSSAFIALTTWSVRSTRCSDNRSGNAGTPSRKIPSASGP